MTTMLERKTMSTAAMVLFAVAASAVVVVLIGAIPFAYATTGVIAMPLLILLVGAAIALLSVGYTAMARRVRHSAVYYSAIGRGLGRPMGVGGGMVALLGYNAIITAQFGLFGTTAADLFGVGPWWAWALGAAALVAVFGLRGITSSTILLGVVLAGSLLVVALFDIAALGNPAGGQLTSTGFATAGLTGGIGGGIAYAIASLMGFELPGAFAEEKLTGASMATLFAWFSTLGALALLALLLLTSLSALFSLRDEHARRETPWTRWIAPLLGVIAGAVIFSQMLFNLGALLGTAPGSPTRWVIPLGVFLAGLAGVLWGFYLQGARPQVYQHIGRKLPDTNAAVDARLADLPL